MCNCWFILFENQARMDNNKLQTKVHVEPFSGEHKDFPKWEMDAKAMFELEGLECCLDLVFLARMPARNQSIAYGDHQQVGGLNELVASIWDAPIHGHS